MTIIIIFCVLLLVYGIVALVVSATSESKLKYGSISLVFGVLGIIVSSMITVIDAQSTGIVVKPNGVDDEELHTGWHFIWPWNDVYKMDKTIWIYTFAQQVGEGQQAHEDAIWAPTGDGFKLGYDISVTWKIDPDKASWIYANVSEQDGDDASRYKWIEQNIIRAYTKSALTSCTKNYNVIEGYSTKRDSIQKQTFKILSEEIATKGLILEAVNIREVHYNSGYEKAINDKKLAEQEALRLVDVTKQKNELLTQAKIEKDIVIQRAEGEAKALQIKGNSITSNPRIIELELINRWNGIMPTTLITSGNGGQGLILNLAK